MTITLDESTHLLSEELPTGRTVAGVHVTSPFESAPAHLAAE